VTGGASGIGVEALTNSADPHHPSANSAVDR